jgi:putative aldouronate transport system substrate-binding protein
MKKTLFFFLALFLVSTLVFLACSRSKPAAAKGDYPPTSARLAPAPPEQLEAAIPQLNPAPNSPGLPLTKKMVTFSIMAQEHVLANDIANVPIVRKIEQETNVRVEGGFIPTSAWNERKNLALAGGRLPEIFLAGITNADAVTYGSQGMFLPLNDLIDNYAPNIKALYDRYPHLRAEVTSPDGNQYHLTGINGFPFRESGCNIFINTTWLKQLGLPIPQTFDEYKNVLRAFKAMNANIIPLSVIWSSGSNFNMLFNLFTGWGFTMGQNFMSVDENGRIFLAPMHPKFPEALKYFSSLYAEGLLDRETFTQSSADLTAKGRASKPILGSYLDWFGDPVVGAERFNADYGVLEPLQGPYSRLWNRVSGFNSGGTAVITSANRDPILAIQWLDYLYRPEISLQLSRGEIGPVLELREGIFYSKDPPPGMTDNDFRVTYSTDFTFPWALTAEILEHVWLPVSFERKMKEFFPLNKRHLPKKFIPNLMYTPEETSELALYSADIQNYLNRMIPQYITGQADIDSNFPNFITQLEKMGVAKLTAIHQTSYDRFATAQNQKQK